MSLSTLKFLGHSSILLTAQDNSYTIAIDPWLKENPSCPDDCRTIEKLDLIALTHGHADHAGDVIELAKSTGAKVIAIYELANLLVKYGVPESQVLPASKGGSVVVGNYTISLTHALHSNSFTVGENTHYAGEACGIIVSDGTNTIYHAGDTSLFSDLTLIGEQYQPTVALLPIGDRFTMGPKAAARAAKLLAADTVIPVHFGTFDLLTGTCLEFANWCGKEKVESKVVTLEPGQDYKLLSRP